MDDNMTHPIVVYCPAFDEDSGGAIVLHYLVDRLRAVGVDAYGFPWLRRPKDFPSTPCSPFRQIYRNWRLRRRRLHTHPAMNVPLADPAILPEATVVYPEVTAGNPLAGALVVRWCLNRKGFFENHRSFGEDEIHLYYQNFFADDNRAVEPEQVLRIRWIRRDIYSDLKRPDRRGACRMIRKGDLYGTTEQATEDAAIGLDGRSHADIADIFNRTELFYCYDPYTMYGYYAALCGCTPVIVPIPGVGEEEWRPNESDRWGLAYGADRIDWARATREKMIARFDNEQATERASVLLFAEFVAKRRALMDR